MASSEVAHAAERHATAEADLLKAQGDAEQVSQFHNQQTGGSRILLLGMTLKVQQELYAERRSGFFCAP